MQVDALPESVARHMLALADVCARWRAGDETPENATTFQRYMQQCSCDEMLPYYERLWTGLLADSDATNALHAYGWIKQWPPARTEVIDTYLDLIRLPGDRPHGMHADRYYEALDRARGASPEGLVALLADAARSRETRSGVDTQGTPRDDWSDVGACAPAGCRYLMAVLSVADTNSASLIAVPIQPTGQDPPIVLGRMWDRHYIADGLRLHGDLSAPAVSALAPALRPFASLVPALLAQAAVDHGSGRGGVLMSQKERQAEVARRQRGKTVLQRALDPLLARLAPIEALSVLPPEVTPCLLTRPTAAADTYAWFSECQLAEGLAVALGQHAAAAIGPYAARIRATSIPAERNLDDDGLGPVQETDRRRRIDSAAKGRTPNRLETLARCALMRMAEAFDMDAVPCTIKDDVGFDVWQGACASPTVERLAMLLAVARGWGVDPSEPESRRPELLCGRLARDAIVRGVREGARLVPDATARTGRPMMVPAEGKAVDAVCHDDQPDRPFERADDRAIATAMGKAFSAAYKRHPSDADATLLNAAVGLVLKANRLYAVASTGEGRLHTVHTQATLAVLALRSGVRLKPADLSNAGRACAALTPTLALAP
nr:hypothetical protein [Pandoravirus belohorizontensis]